MRGFRPTGVLICLAIWTLCRVSHASAQAAPPAGTTPAVVIQSDDGDNRVQFGGFVQTDGRFTIDDPQQDVTDSFVIRRLRSVTQGQLARHFEFYLNIDFAGGVVNIRDAYFDTRFSPAFRVRLGKSKVPFSYDRLILAVNTPFIERGFTTMVAPDRDTGVQILGDLAGTIVSYGVSVTNGVVDGGNSDLDTNENKDVAGRLVLRPFVRRAGHSLAGLGIAVAANTGIQPEQLPVFQTSSKQTFFSYSGAIGDGRRTRWSPQAFMYAGPLGAYAEYVRSHGGVRAGSRQADVDHESWLVAASWVITGEPASDRNVRPRVNFDPPTRHFGALQATARYQSLAVSRDALSLGLASPGSSRTAEAWTVGVNWYLNPFVKWNANFERTVFDHGPDGPHQPENAILIRAHLGF